MQALARVTAERGYERVTVAAVAECAGIPAGEFSRFYASTDECLLALYDETVAALTRSVDDAIAPCSAAGGDDHWRTQLDAGFGAVLRHLSALPAVACACIVEALALGRPALQRRDAALDRFVGYVDVLRRVQGAALPPLAAEMLVRGGYELIYARVARGEAEELPALLGDLRRLWNGPYAPAGG
jgi:AcrR family transcriptional regulator